MSHSLLRKIEEEYKDLSKGHKKVAKYIAEHYDRAAFMTASKLGETVGISESTVVRFATELGFNGYPELQKAIQEMIRSKLTAVQRMDVTAIRIGDDILTNELLSDAEMIRDTIEQTSHEDFNKAVENINKAKKIYILGVRSSAPLASFLAYYFNLIFDNVVIVDTTSESEIFEQTFRIGEGDVCIAISFPRYSRQIINAIKFISDRGAKVIAITDSNHSPMAPYASNLLIAKSNIASVVDSLVAPLSLINALIVAVSLSRREEVAKNFDELEEIWEQYKVYDTTEENTADE